MKQTWKDYEDVPGPMALMFKVFAVVLVLVVLIGVSGHFLGWFAEAAQVAREEFGPRAALQKYEWFKDASAQLDRKKADIEIFESRVKILENAYGEDKRSTWTRDDRENHSLWQSELAGLRSSYNGLAAEYNAQMAKFNWQFADVGRLPAGAADPLPREIKPYDVGGAP